METTRGEDIMLVEEFETPKQAAHLLEETS
jgi:hypothetical protein